jgi:hypothetical protein
MNDSQRAKQNGAALVCRTQQKDYSFLCHKSLLLQIQVASVCFIGLLLLLLLLLGLKPSGGGKIFSPSTFSPLEIASRVEAQTIWKFIPESEQQTH